MIRLFKSKTLILLLVFGVIYISILHFKMVEHGNLKPENQADYLIILGARVKGQTPSLVLQYRIEKAAEYLIENPETIAIASGGKGRGEDVSEAMCIKQELQSRGIDDSRILLEDQSTTTYENIAFSKKLIPIGSTKGLLVTNDFHIFRAKMIAKSNGLELDGLPSNTPTIAVPKSYVREYLALTKYFLIQLF